MDLVTGGNIIIDSGYFCRNNSNAVFVFYKRAAIHFTGC